MCAVGLAQPSSMNLVKFEEGSLVTAVNTVLSEEIASLVGPV